MIDSLKTLTSGLLEISKGYKGNWNESDSSSPNYIENKPFYSETTEFTIIPEGDYEIGPDADELFGPYVNITRDSVLNIIFDGETYSCKVGIESGGEFITGNLFLINEDPRCDTGEPFVLYIYPENEDYTYVFVQLGPDYEQIETHRFGLSTETETVKKIDSKYLPELNCIGTPGTGEDSEIFNNIENIASAWYSHAEGNHTTASGDWSHAEGNYTTAEGESSHAEGSFTTASGESSHAEGYSTTASEYTSHAEGTSTKASGGSSHAEGGSTKASNYYSHAEGWKTTASGERSHAEGGFTTASGKSSHAEGDNTTASGESSHAEGYGTTAYGNYSHTEGFRTKASGEYQHVQGKYNIEDTEDTYAHIIGNGTADNARSNAHTVDWDGNAWYAGDITVGTNNTKVSLDGHTHSGYEERIAALEAQVEFLTTKLQTAIFMK